MFNKGISPFSRHWTGPHNRRKLCPPFGTCQFACRRSLGYSPGSPRQNDHVTNNKADIQSRGLCAWNAQETAWLYRRLVPRQRAQYPSLWVFQI